MGERDAKEPGLGFVPVTAPLHRSVLLSVGRGAECWVEGSSFILPKLPSFLIFLERLPGFSFSKFPHLQALECVMLQKKE